MIYFLYVSGTLYPDPARDVSTRILVAELMRRKHKCVAVSFSHKEKNFHQDGAISIQTAVPHAWMSNLIAHDKPRPDIILTRDPIPTWTADIISECQIPVMSIDAWVNLVATGVSACVDRFLSEAEALLPGPRQAVEVASRQAVEVASKPEVAFFGPWIGELGWELAIWQSFCRKEAKKYVKSYVCSFIGMRSLYEDFAEFVPHFHPLRELWGPDPRDIDYSKVDYTVPSGVGVQIEPIWGAVPTGDFIKFGNDPNDEFSCLVHARYIQTHGQSFKNYSKELWSGLAGELPESAASVGTLDDLHVEGTTDLRGIPLGDLMNYMAGCDIVVGGSSGPMILAVLCGAPIVVWGPKDASGGSLEERLRRVWNPFGTGVEYILSETWQPDPVEVSARVNRVLCSEEVGDVKGRDPIQEGA